LQEVLLGREELVVGGERLASESCGDEVDEIDEARQIVISGGPSWPAKGE
jgi:hypothetical protein